MKKYDAVIAGFTCVDLTVDFKKGTSFTGITDLFKPGKLIEIGGLSLAPGGAVANTGFAMKKFGKKVFLCGLTGEDIIGEIARKWFDRYELSDGIQSTDKAGTATSIVIAPPGVDRIFLESAGCNQIFDKSNIDFDAVSQCRLFHFGYPPLLRQFYQDNGEKLLDLFSEIHQMGVVTSLDFSLPDPESESGTVDWKGIMYRVLPYVDVFTPGLEEILQIMMPGKLDEIQSASDNGEWTGKVPLGVIREVGNQIIGAGTRILLIKAGALGAYLVTGDVSSLNQHYNMNLDKVQWNHCELWCPAYPAEKSKIHNACGAGDTATAAFLSAIMDRENPGASMKYAAMAGRNNLYCHDLNTDLEDWKEMTEEINADPGRLIDLESFHPMDSSDIRISELMH